MKPQHILPNPYQEAYKYVFEANHCIFSFHINVDNDRGNLKESV